MLLNQSFSLPCDFHQKNPNKRKRGRKRKKRNAAIVSIEDDTCQDTTRSQDVKNFPLDDSTVKKTSDSNSDSKSSSVRHGRSSSFPENIAGNAPKESKSSSFVLEDFLENVIAEPTYDDTVGEGVQDTPTGDDRGNFVFEAADLFLKQPKMDREDRNSLQFQNITKNDNNKATVTTTSTVCQNSDESAVRQIQGDSKENGNDLLQSRNVSERESFGASLSSTKTHYSQGNKDLYGREKNLDSFHAYSLTENHGRSSESNFSVAQMKVPTVAEKRTVATEALNESQGSTPVHLDNLQEDLQEDSSSAQEYQDFRHSPSGKAFQLENTENNKELDEEDFRDDLYDYEAASSAESQSHDGTIEPVVLLDSGESLVPLTEGDRVTAKTGAQSTFYYAPDVSAENDRADSGSLSSTSWSYIEDGEELSEQKDDLLLNNRPASDMTSSDASVAAAALAACTDAQRGMDNMSRGFIAVDRTMGGQAGQRDFSSKHDGMSTGKSYKQGNPINQVKK
ncbi:hypothetical protein OS493_011077 [Desmophyllum pertusum]|uniref:Uncharacterized protein n=1 Tax=Desmophyllum pertusum TaxID=174260 RepID=A0A9X0CRM2_9CNID|nr:hypothetical protein OS493_011077 [Desmophyllum pertusum]